jgi:hypothetical protein
MSYREKLQEKYKELNPGVKSLAESANYSEGVGAWIKNNPIKSGAAIGTVVGGAKGFSRQKLKNKYYRKGQKDYTADTTSQDVKTSSLKKPRDKKNTNKERKATNEAPALKTGLGVLGGLGAGHLIGKKVAGNAEKSDKKKLKRISKLQQARQRGYEKKKENQSDDQSYQKMRKRTRKI